jgi:HSP20 family protein
MTWYQNWPDAASYAALGENPWVPVPHTHGAGAPLSPTGPTGQQHAGAGTQSQSSTPASEQASGAASPPVAVPMVDVVESASELVVRVDVPGFEKDQLEIHADANQLYVTGDRSGESGVDAEDGERALVTERPVRIERAIPLSVHIDPEQVTATHENGVCEIVVPKDENDRRHQIGFQ